VAWSVKVTEEYAAWFTALIKDDLASAIQVAQAVAALREEGPRSAGPGGPDPGQQDPSPQGAAARLGCPVRDPGALRVRPTRSALLLLGGDKAGNWQRWYKENIPVAEQLYLDYTTGAEE
jgi:hypothetical protein